MIGPGEQQSEDRVLRAIERLDDRLRSFQEEIANRFANLDARFMPRDQLLDRFEEARSARLDILGDIQAVNTRVDDVESRRVIDRRFVITTGLMALTVLVAAISVVVVVLTSH